MSQFKPLVGSLPSFLRTWAIAPLSSLLLVLPSGLSGAHAECAGFACTVTDAGDGAGSSSDVTLRYALTYANAAPGTSIGFAKSIAGSTITLTSELPLILGTGTVIDGGNDKITVSGANTYRAFFIGGAGQTGTPASTVATITNLTIANTNARGGSGSGGGAGLGGAIFVSSTGALTIANVVLARNAATGGRGSGLGGGGGMGGDGGAGGGGFGNGATGGGSFPSNTGTGGRAGAFTNGAPGGAGGSGVAYNNGETGGGGAGGLNGGGGGSGAGAGGFGGGAGGGGGVGGQAGNFCNGGAGGFGGGGGNAGGVTGCGLPGGGAGGFGGGGGGGYLANVGGFGGGAGFGVEVGVLSSGFGGGYGTGGGGGAGLGGAIFVMGGGSLTIGGTLDVNGSSVTGGAGGGGAGSAFGSGLFLNGYGTITFQPGRGQTQTVSDAIADQNGSGGATVSNGVGGVGGVWQLTKAGDGTLTLSAVNAYSGATTVNGGTLKVNGSIASSSLTTVNNGGALAGVGTVGNTTIANGGILMPGNGAPHSSMTVAGNLALQSGALYLLQLNPATSSLVKVTGTAALGGAIVNAIYASGEYVAKRYKILTATGGVSGTFGSLVNTNLPLNFTPSLSYDAKDAYLKLELNFSVLSSLSSNQRNVGQALTNFFNTTGSIPLAFGALSPASLTQIDGEAATAAERGSFQLMNAFLGLMLDPLIDGRSDTTGSEGPTQRFTPEAQASLPPYMALAYSGPLDAPAPLVVERRWSVWGTAFGGSNSESGNAAVGSNSVTTATYGFASGLDYRLTPNTVVGFSLAGSGTNWGLAQGIGSGRSDAFQAGVYGMTRNGPAYVSGALAFTDNWFTTNRTAFGDKLTAGFTGQSYGARLEGGYRYKVLPTFGVTPYAAAQAQNFRTPAYSETDVGSGGFGLSYAAMSATDVRTELGSRFDAPTLFSDMPLILRGRIAWAHDFVGNPSRNATFQALPGASFTVNGAPIPHDAALASAGLELVVTPHLSVLAKFDDEFAAGSQTFAGTGTVRYTW